MSDLDNHWMHYLFFLTQYQQCEKYYFIFLWNLFCVPSLCLSQTWLEDDYQYVWDWHIVSFTFTAYAIFNLHNLSLSLWETYLNCAVKYCALNAVYYTNSNICWMIVPIVQILFWYTIQFPSFQAEAKVTIWYHDCNLPEGMSFPYSV